MCIMQQKQSGYAIREEHAIHDKKERRIYKMVHRWQHEPLPKTPAIVDFTQML